MVAFIFILAYSVLVVVSNADMNDKWGFLWSKSTASKDERSSIPGTSIITESDLRPLDRRIWIITTACLPWMTGTSVNPLLRAAYLAKDRPPGMVTLMVPWINEEDQNIAYPAGIRFNNPDEQEAYVRKWLLQEAKMPIAAERLKIMFYAGRFHDEFHSIFPMGDLVELIPEDQADVCVLEEPEHLNWYRAPFTAKTWKQKFRHVIGVMHTNYLMYSRSQTGGIIKEPMLYIINQAMCRAYCHKIIKLSGALQEFAPEMEEISNVHGVRASFLAAGEQAALAGFKKGAYFVGKMAWQKGLDQLFMLMKYTEERSGDCFSVDIFGHGPHEKEIRATAARDNLNVSFFGPKDHSKLTEYRVFVNPSVTEVLCTTVAEALAMGKWVICPQHPSNAFFEQFPNCLTYRSKEEFAANMLWALNNEPAVLSEELKYKLSWEAATDRFISAAAVTEDMLRESKAWEVAEMVSRTVHTWIGSGAHGDTVRLMAGARQVANQIDYVREHGTASPTPIKISDEILPVDEEDEETARDESKATLVYG